MSGQTDQALKNLGAVLEAAGSSYGQVVKTTILLADMDDFADVNKVYGTVSSESEDDLQCCLRSNLILAAFTGCPRSTQKYGTCPVMYVCSCI